MNDASPTIGAVFTPLQWGAWVVEEFGLREAWLEGKTILDPTCGEGHLLEALIFSALEKGVPAAELPLQRLFGIEQEAHFLEAFRTRIKKAYNIELPQSNLLHRNLLLEPVELRCDILLGNPPWCNFTDLPAPLKPLLKPIYQHYGMAGKSSELLLGNSRVDIAALVIAKSIKDHLNANGRALFFAPLSLLLGEGAHKNFRRFEVQGTRFRIESVHDFGAQQIFENVSARYALLNMRRDAEPVFPVPYFVRKRKTWEEMQARPFAALNDAWLIQATSGSRNAGSFERIALAQAAAPRQGINTGGANDVFIFNLLSENDDGSVTVKDARDRTHRLPARFVYPLLTSENFRDNDFTPHRYVLLPYEENGNALSSAALKKEPLLDAYLQEHRERLEARKGPLLRARIRQGCWWALFGVGAYNFAPYKIVWEAYGRSTFRPMLVEGRVQVNQSLQAYIPFYNKREARRMLKALKGKYVEEYLRAQSMSGTMNWAQPGKMRKLFELT